ncbi:MAG: cupin domain-containing protein [Gammaproteobacteria bacterium]|nr:cupin domain-containing protein [Gammaproteobacteria bacterium]MCP5425382.1 cupin domain-containing protein [Gammaproteobacteria bacterium]
MKTLIQCLLLSFLVTACAVPEYSEHIQSTQLIKTTTSWNGQPLPAYPDGTPEITILRITIPPKGLVPLHLHPVINAGVLLKGKLSVTTEAGDELHLEPNEPIVEVVNTWHYGKNEGDTPAEILVFYAGKVGTPVTITQSPEKP